MQGAAVDLGLLIGFASLGVALVATVIAVWQGWLSRRQLQLARETQGKTEDALKEIRDLTAETRHLTREIKADIDDRITRIIDQRLEVEREPLEKARRSEQQGAEMAGKLGSWLADGVAKSGSWLAEEVAKAAERKAAEEAASTRAAIDLRESDSPAESPASPAPASRPGDSLSQADSSHQ